MTEDRRDRRKDIERITRLVPKVITREHNEQLLKHVSIQEVEEEVNQMDLGKALGPDGFTTNFFHFFWDSIKVEVLEIVEESRCSRDILKSFNATFITLISKGE